ncbi:MAG: hypothetical protein HYV28_10665 [Ignavibacteriales bacterium]|nr:hypothetical protein [Ignavibacteriales bacterium]
MVLETLDVKKNDIFIYSLNMFSLTANFKLLNKDAKVKYPKSIHYNDVCRYITDGRPKNLILYRLLTNLPSMDINYLKYGFPMQIDGQREVLYFDPVFAIKELEEYSELEYYPNLRFRIQQIGLISMMRSFGEQQYHETYSFDLEAAEVKHQNDRVFAELIFVFDEVHFDEEDVNLPKQPERQIPQRRFVAMTADELKTEMIEEDPATNLSTIRKLKATHTQTGETLAEEMTQKLRKRMTLETPAHPPKPADNKKHFEVINSAQQPQEPLAQQKPQPAPTQAPVPTRRVSPPSVESVRQTVSKAKPTFSDFLTKVKRNQEQEQKEPESSEPPQVINLFKTSSHVQNFVAERSTKQVVLKLKSK